MRKNKILILLALSVVLGGVTPAQADWGMAFRTLLGSQLYDVAFLEDRLIIAAQDAVITLDYESNEISRHMLDPDEQYAILADSGRYGVINHRPRVPQFTETIAIFDGDAQIADFPIEGTPYLSPRGDWLVTTDRYSKAIRIYGESGELRQTDTYPLVKNVGIAFADDNRTVLLNLPQNIQEAIAVRYRANGRRSGALEHNLGYANPCISATGGRIAIVGRAMVDVYDETGAMVVSFERGNRAGPGTMAKDGTEFWLAEDDGIRIENIINGDTRIVALDDDMGAVVKLVEDPSGRYILIGQRIERRETGVVWSWQVIERQTGTQLWHGEERKYDGYTNLGPGVILKGTDEIEVWRE